MREEIIEWNIDPMESGKRLDRVLAQHDSNWSRTQVQQWIQEERVRVNGFFKRGNYRVKANDQIKIELPMIQPLLLEPEPIPLDIRYEDSDLLILNKPAGMVVHPSAGHRTGTLVHALLAHCPHDLSGIGGYARPGIVHRLDKDTSGLMVVAKNDRAHQALTEQLQARTLTRQYVALVHGRIPHQYGTIQTLIGRDPNHRQRMAVVEKNGKQAITHFSVVRRWNNETWVSCQLETGRTHQIRVHMRYIGHPILGDPTYGSRRKEILFDRQALHAQKLILTHPTSGKELRVEAELPADMEQLIDQLASSSEE